MPVALVTGAGRGIGRSVASRLSAAGYRVALTSRRQDDLEATASACDGPTLVVPGDITDAAFVDELFAHIEREWAPVQVLVANAGAGVSASVVRTTDEQWQQMLDLNLTAPFRCIRRALPTMVDAAHGRIVVIGELESSAFHAQSQQLAKAWPDSATAPVVLSGRNHFTACDDLRRPGRVRAPSTNRDMTTL